MKKWIALCLSLVMLLCICGCGSDKAETEETEGKSLQAALNGETKPQIPATEMSEAPPATEPSGTKYECPLFTLYYQEEDGWIVRPESEFQATETRCDLELLIPKNEQVNDAYFKITVVFNDASYYRSDLHSMGYDPEVAAAGGTYEPRVIDGLELYEGEDFGSMILRGRDVPSGMDISIKCFDNKETELYENILSSLSFTLPDSGHEDPPLFSEGEPYLTEEHTATLGNMTLTSRQIPIEPSLETWDIFKQDIAAAGNKVYLITTGTLLEYDYDGSTMKLNREIPLPDTDYERIDYGSNGRLMVSGFMNDLVLLENGEQAAVVEDIDRLAVSPDGAWGITYFFSGEDLEKVTLPDGNTAPMPLPVNNVRIHIDNTYLYISGSSTEDGTGDHNLFVFDHNGTLRHQLKGAEGKGMGCITFASKTPGGFLGVDANYRCIRFWDNSGNYLGEIEDDALFGTYYPWMANAEMLPDGSMLVVLVEERPDESGDEVLVFRISGF